MSLTTRVSQLLAEFTLSPIKDGLQQWREGCGGGLVQPPQGGRDRFECFLNVHTLHSVLGFGLSVFGFVRFVVF